MHHSRSIFATVVTVGFLPPVLDAMLFAPGTRAQTLPSDLCGISEQYTPVVSPKIYSGPISPQSDQALECVMWQSFIYLNWPSEDGVAGSPDTAKRFGSPGPTVWQTYMPHDQAFLPGGETPGPWRNRMVPQIAGPLADNIAKGQVRQLRQVTKFSSELSGSLRQTLGQVIQAGGGKLFDQNGQPVHYEMLLNEDMYNYIFRHRLYAADSQLSFARQNGIELPSGPSEYGEIGTIEIKAAWKVMSETELAQRPLRFHTMPAVLEDDRRVTVGLVGMHIHQRLAAFPQGVWATFGQIDNTPLASDVGHSRSYSFFDTACSRERCPPNTQMADGMPTQVVRMFPNTYTVERINAFVRNLIDIYGRNFGDQDNPWRYYELLGVQWPKHPEEVGKAGQEVPLSLGDSNRDTLVNPVLETFMQADRISCLRCHSHAHGPNGSRLATGYSFLLEHAK
jgi:hypothetical protein